MCFMQNESVLQTKDRSEPAKNRFSVALVKTIKIFLFHKQMSDGMTFFLQKGQISSLMQL